jgi:hypothetical protein
MYEVTGRLGKGYIVGFAYGETWSVNDGELTREDGTGVANVWIIGRLPPLILPRISYDHPNDND